MQDTCTVSQTVRYLSKRWTLLIILELYKGERYTRRFSELRDALPGITPKVLSERLKELEQEEIITRTVDATAFPVRTEYSLTESGLAIIGIIRDIKRWALKWKIDNIACREQDCKVCVL
ncbi:MAG: helix-turn-helix domain-containing protein [Methanoregulaceae archaeon]|jgi:DNA-binding HxlR family transcriptional regulator